jgi:hypothetical protein
LLFIPASDKKPSFTKPFTITIRKHWLNILAICATILGISSTIYFIFYTDRSQEPRQPIVFDRNYDSDTCKLTLIDDDLILNRKQLHGTKIFISTLL